MKHRGVEDARAAKESTVHALLLSLGFGRVTASVLAIASVGLSLQFGITNYINFAYGEHSERTNLWLRSCSATAAPFHGM